MRAAIERAPREAAPAPASLVDPRGVYTLAQATRLLGLRRSSLPREIRERRLQVSRRCGKYFIRGIWLISWINAGKLVVAKPAEAPAE
jgi:hypothetical protein